MSVIGWEQPTRKYGLKANMMGGVGRGAAASAVSQLCSTSWRSDSCIFMATIISVTLQHFILAQIKRLAKSLTSIHLKHG